MRTWFAPFLLASLIFSAGSPHAQDFYKGKVIRVIVGGSPGGGFDIYTRAMARHMGKHIPGNPSLMVENMTGAGTLKTAWAKAIPAGEVNVVWQVSAKKLPDLPNVPLALDLAKTEEAKLLLRAGAIDPAAVVRVYVTTPRIARDRLQILRNAFAKTLTDPEFVAEAKSGNLDINPLTGEKVKKIVDGLFELPPPTLTKLSDVLAAREQHGTQLSEQLT